MTLKQRWRDFARGKPGQRFQDRYQQRRGSRHGLLRKSVVLTGGVLIFAAGLFFMPAPGPGLIIVFIGACMLADESLGAARVLDYCELSLRKLWARLRRGRKKPGKT